VRDEREQASPILRASDSLRQPRTEAGRRVSAVLGGFFTPSILGVWLSCQDPSETHLVFRPQGLRIDRQRASKRHSVACSFNRRDVTAWSEPPGSCRWPPTA